MLLIDQGNTRTKFAQVRRGRVELLAVVPTADAARAVDTLPLGGGGPPTPHHEAHEAHVGCGERSKPHQGQSEQGEPTTPRHEARVGCGERSEPHHGQSDRGGPTTPRREARVGCGERSEPHHGQATNLIAAGVSSAGPAREALTAALAARGIPIRWIVSEHAGGLRLSYREPARLGADRYAAMRGAWARVNGAVVVIDAGTAITIDALDAHGHQVAALLLPGFGLQRSALARGTAAVRPSATRRLQLAARDTDGAVDAGLWSAVLGALDRVVAAVQPTLVLATGGDAPLLARRWQGPVPIRHRPTLVLEGVWVVAAER